MSEREAYVVTPLSNGYSGFYVEHPDGRRLSLGGTDEDPARAAAERFFNPQPTAQQHHAVQLAEQRGESVCSRCGGAGGWRGWPGYTCYGCNGRGTTEVAA